MATEVTAAAHQGLSDVLGVAQRELGRLLGALGTSEAPEDMLWLWYPRGEAVALGVWAETEEREYEDGDGAWRKGIEGWNLPSAPPWAEVVLRLEQCGPALRAYAETADRYTAEMLNGAIRRADRRLRAARRVREAMDRVGRDGLLGMPRDEAVALAEELGAALAEQREAG
jgi:hypothetical protein